MNGLWPKNLGWSLGGTALGLALIYVVKTFVTHTAIDWHVFWEYPLVVLTAYSLLVGVRYLRGKRRH